MSVNRVRRPTLLVAIAAFALLASTGCRWTPPDDVVLRALVCDECTTGQFDSVLVHGDRSVPMLLSALSQPPANVTRDARGTVIREWRRASRGNPARGAFDSAQTVDAGVEHFTTAYQRRAALLLRKIGTPSARRALGVAVMSLPPRRSAQLRGSARELADSLWRSFP